MVKQIHKPDYIYIIHNIQITSICNHPVIFGGSQGYFFNDFWRNDEGLAASQLRLRHLQQGQLLWPRLILWMGQRNPNHQLKTMVNIPWFIGFQHVSTIRLVGLRGKINGLVWGKTQWFLPSNIGLSGSDFSIIQFYDKWLICFLIRNLEDVEALLILEDGWWRLILGGIPKIDGWYLKIW